jgi:hypothetical protein
VKYEDAFLIRDVDGDGNPDIAFLDGITNSLVLLYGTAAGRFTSPQVAHTAGGVSTFRVAPLVHTNALDLILVYQNRHMVSVLHDPFRRGR